MFILKIIYINNRECAHCGLYPHFMDLTGLVFCSCKSKFHCNVYMKYRRNPPKLGCESLTDLY